MIFVKTPQVLHQTHQVLHQTPQVLHQTPQVLHQTHQVLHQIKFFNLNSESCVNTIGVDNYTLDETLDTLDAFDDSFCCIKP